MKENKELDQYIADALMGRPYSFSAGNSRFSIFPLTLGKIHLMHRLVEELGIDGDALQRNVSLEALRLAREKRSVCLAVIAYHTMNSPKELFDNVIVSERISLLDAELNDEDIAALMIIILTSDRTNAFMHHLGIDKEQERMAEVMRIKSKDDKNNFTFGGKSVFGTLIDTACERYGWTKEYVVWGIDYASLRLMLADKVSSVYCTDEELKKMPAFLRNRNDAVIMPTKENMEAIMSMDWR